MSGLANDSAAYRVSPPGRSLGRVVVVHEIFGLTPHIRSVCDRLAEAGYAAVAPDLFFDALRGECLPYSAEGKQRGLAIKNARGEAALAADVAAWVDALAADDDRVAVMGFCLGGLLAWLAAASSEAACVVGYYSVGLGRHAGVRAAVPALMHFGAADPSIPGTEVAQFRALNPQAIVQIYDAGHAFNRDDDAPYQAAAATLAWQRTLAFLQANFATSSAAPAPP